jgi:hypothetical protein
MFDCTGDAIGICIADVSKGLAVSGDRTMRIAALIVIAVNAEAPEN